MKTWTRYTLITLLLGASLSAGILTWRACTAAPEKTVAATSTSFLDTPLPDSTNTIHTLNQWKGKVRVVNFWATWCPPCREEIPLFMKAQKNWGPKGVQFIGIAIDNATDVSRYAKELRINYPLLIAEEQGPPLMMAQGNKVGALPFTLVIDGSGRVLQRHAGEVTPALLDGWLKAATAKH